MTIPPLDVEAEIGRLEKIAAVVKGDAWDPGLSTILMRAAALIRALAAERDRLTQERDEAREALEPFAALDDEGSEDFPDDTKATTRYGRTTDYSLTLGDFRRAAQALRSHGGGS